MPTHPNHRTPPPFTADRAKMAQAGAVAARRERTERERRVVREAMALVKMPDDVADYMATTQMPRSIRSGILAWSVRTVDRVNGIRGRASREYYRKRTEREYAAIMQHMPQVLAIIDAIKAADNGK